MSMVRAHLPAMPNGAKKPVAKSQCQKPFQSSSSWFKPHTHEQPVSDKEESGERVEGNVASWALGIVIGRAELRASRGKVATSDGSPETRGGGCSREHLQVFVRTRCQVLVSRLRTLSGDVETAVLFNAKVTS